MTEKGLVLQRHLIEIQLIRARLRLGSMQLDGIVRQQARRLISPEPIP
jgi:hypothetical protein